MQLYSSFAQGLFHKQKASRETVEITYLNLF